MNDLCIGVIVMMLLFLFGELLYRDAIPGNGRHPIQQETMSLHYGEEE